MRLSHIVALISLSALSLPAQDPSGTTTAAPRRRIASWTADRRDFAVGDIIKVAVDEYALAAANKGTVSEASRERRMGVGAGASMGSSGVNVGPADGSLQTGDKGTSRSRGEATRGSRYVGEIPVRVVAITPEGLLQVSGMKVIDVDKNKQEMTLSGLVRPQDVDSRDVVESSSIADARLVYISKGLDRPKSGILGRIVGIIWP
jgi:flagellar L-ring protein precursor FlgH